MKPLIIVLLCFLPLTSNATLLRYIYDDRIGTQGPDNLALNFDAYGILTVDSSIRRLVAFEFASEPLSFNWTGEARLVYPEQNDQERRFNTFETVNLPGRDAGFLLNLDIFFLEAGKDVFENLDAASIDDGGSVFSDGKNYGFYGKLQKAQPFEVPEPATLSLLALGLAAIGIRRRLRYS